MAMTEKDAELFLTLKFSSMDDIMVAFDNAIGVPHGHLRGTSAHHDMVRTGIMKWVEQGCPDKMDIADEDVDFFLKLKFGGLQEAYNHWVRTPPGNPHGLTEKELAIVMDYIPESTESVDK